MKTKVLYLFALTSAILLSGCNRDNPKPKKTTIIKGKVVTFREDSLYYNGPVEVALYASTTFWPAYEIDGRLSFEFKEELISNCEKLGKLYLDLDTKEVWTIRTFINLIKQIEVSAYLKQLDQETGSDLIDRLENQISTVLQFALRGRKRGGKFELLQSDYLMMTNNALLMAGHIRLAFTSYAGVNYFSSMDPNYTANIKDWFELSFRHATVLNRKNPTDVEHYRKVLFERCALARERIRTANPDVLAD